MYDLAIFAQGRMGQSSVGQWRRAMVVFSDSHQPRWLALLKPGYRHCAIVLESAQGLVMIDPVSHSLQVALLPDMTLSNLQLHYESSGYVCVEVTPRVPSRKIQPIRPFSCVETVKRILGIHAPWVWTPWQLYKYIKSYQKEKKHLTKLVNRYK